MDGNLTHWTARVAMGLYAAGLMGMLLRWPPARWVFPVWAAGCLVFLLHVGCAFHEVHGWSHAAALHHTAAQTEIVVGFATGAGLYLNYAFLLIWAGDALYWWVRPERYRARTRWITLTLHGFLFFMAFNATVVFASGPTRWVGLCVSVFLPGVWCRTRKKVRPE